MKFYGSNAWLNADGSVTPVKDHEEDGGYTSATLKKRIRVVSQPQIGKLIVDASYASKFSSDQIASIRAIYAQTRATLLSVAGWTTSQQYPVHAREIEGVLSNFDPANP